MHAALKLLYITMQIFPVTRHGLTHNARSNSLARSLHRRAMHANHTTSPFIIIQMDQNVKQSWSKTRFQKFCVLHQQRLAQGRATFFGLRADIG